MSFYYSSLRQNRVKNLEQCRKTGVFLVGCALGKSNIKFKTRWVYESRFAFKIQTSAYQPKVESLVFKEDVEVSGMCFFCMKAFVPKNKFVAFASVLKFCLFTWIKECSASAILPPNY